MGGASAERKGHAMVEAWYCKATEITAEQAEVFEIGQPPGVVQHSFLQRAGKRQVLRRGYVGHDTSCLSSPWRMPGVVGRAVVVRRALGACGYCTNNTGRVSTGPVFVAVAVLGH